MKKYIIYLMFILILIVGCQSEKEKGYTFEQLNRIKIIHKYDIEDIVILKINGTKCLVIDKSSSRVATPEKPIYYCRCEKSRDIISIYEFELEPYIK